MDGRPKRSAAAAAALVLPDDALVEILSRVPARSLFRFKCVSTAWRDLIADRLRCNNLPQTLAGFFLNDGNEMHGGGVGEDRVIGHLVNTLGRFTPLASISFLGKQPGIEAVSLLHSCNGLLLFGHRRPGDIYDSLGYIVCNPATEQWVAVPNSSWKPFSFSLSGLVEIVDVDAYTEPKSRFAYLIFDPAVPSHFQFLEFWIWTYGGQNVEEVHTYSSETGMWTWCTRICQWDLEEFFPGSTLVNGMLHFSVTLVDIRKIRRKLILAFDGEGGECRFISVPEKHADVAFVGQSQGRLLYLTQHRDSTSDMTELSIWVLQDYDAEEWVLKHSVTFLQLFGRMDCEVVFDYKVVAIHPDRNLIFFVQHWDQKLKSYDMDSREVCTLRILGSGPQNIVPYAPYFAESSALVKKH